MVRRVMRCDRPSVPAAGLTVHDDTGGKPVFGKWKPYDARAAVAVPLPMRESESMLSL